MTCAGTCGLPGGGCRLRTETERSWAWGRARTLESTRLRDDGETRRRLGWIGAAWLVFGSLLIILVLLVGWPALILLVPMVLITYYYARRKVKPVIEKTPKLKTKPRFVEYGSAVVINTIEADNHLDARPHGCGWYGCRVLKPSGPRGVALALGHGGDKPPVFYVHGPPDDPSRTGRVEYNDKVVVSLSADPGENKCGQYGCRVLRMYRADKPYHHEEVLAVEMNHGLEDPQVFELIGSSPDAQGPIEFGKGFGPDQCLVPALCGQGVETLLELRESL